MIITLTFEDRSVFEVFVNFLLHLYFMDTKLWIAFFFFWFRSSCFYLRRKARWPHEGSRCISWNRKNETTKDASLPLSISLFLFLFAAATIANKLPPRTAVGRVIYISFWSHYLLGTLMRQFKSKHHAYKVQGVACMCAFTVRSLSGAVRKPNEL